MMAHPVGKTTPEPSPGDVARRAPRGPPRQSAALTPGRHRAAAPLDRPGRWVCPFRQLRRRLARGAAGTAAQDELYRYLLRRHLRS
jgi:hypothetical protein